MVTIVDTVSATPLRPRHPEKVNRPDALSPPKPDWIRVRAPNTRGYADTRKIVKENGLVTVCEAGCPNIGECWDRSTPPRDHGDTCTRACAFCNVKTGMPGRSTCPAGACGGGDLQAGWRISSSRRSIATIRRRRRRAFCADHSSRAARRRRSRSHAGFCARKARWKRWSRPNPTCSTIIRNRAVAISRCGRARYFHSIRLLQRVKEIDHHLHQVRHHGRPWERHEVLQVMDDLRSAEVDFLTIGHICSRPVASRRDALRHPDEFSGEKVAYTKGFLMVSAADRSSSRRRDFANSRRGLHFPVAMPRFSSNAGFSTASQMF